MILVVLENQRGNIHAFSKEAVAAGQSLCIKIRNGFICFMYG